MQLRRRIALAEWPHSTIAPALELYYKPADEASVFSMLVELVHVELLTQNMISEVANYRGDYIHSGASPHTV